MNVIVAGHRYMLENFEQAGKDGQTIRFIHKEPVSKGSLTLKTMEDGTTNEEVITVLIDRMNYLQKKMPCKNNEVVIKNLTASLALLQDRTAKRIVAKVEGTNAPGEVSEEKK